MSTVIFLLLLVLFVALIIYWRRWRIIREQLRRSRAALARLRGSYVAMTGISDSEGARQEPPGTADEQDDPPA